MISSLRRQLPAIPRGYAIAPAASWFSVVVPIARTNLVTNPSFETGTVQYGVTGASTLRVTTQQYHGVYSLQVTPLAGIGTNGVYHGPIALTSGQLYACSCKILGAAGVAYQIAITTITNVELAVYRFIATGRWQWVWLYYQETSSTTRRFSINKSNNASVAPFYVDGVQVEAIAAGEYVSTYIDGDQAGLVPNQSPPAYLWTGTPHASTSTRSGQTRAGGTVMRLDYYGFVLLAMIGLGLPIPNNVSVPYVLLDGAQYERTQKPPRQFTLAGRWDSAGYQQLARETGDLGAALDRDNVGQQQPLTLLYQALDSCDGPISDTARIICTYQGGLEGVTDNLHAEQSSIVFKHWLPLIQGDGEAGASLNVQSSVTNANHILIRSAAGVWGAVGSGASGGNVFVITQGLDGAYYIGGNFTSFGGVANTKSIAKYDPNTGTISALGTGAGGGTQIVNDIQIAPNGDVWVTGDITDMGGVAAADYVARWDGSAWNGVGVPSAIPILTVPASACFGSDGQFYYATDSNKTVKRWDGANWSTIGNITVGAGARGCIRAPDGSIIAFGGIATISGVAVSNVARWTPSTAAWTAIGGTARGAPLAMAYDAAGALYAALGSLTDTVLDSNNGVAWTSLDTINAGGPGAAAYGVAANLLGAGLYVSGTFAQANGVTLPDGMGLWNGSLLAPLDVDLPGTATVYTIRVFRDGAIGVGFDTTGTAVAASTTTITNTGSAKTYPTLIIKGPSSGSTRVYQVLNITTNRAVYLNLTINAGETVMLSFAPDNLRFTSDFHGNVASAIVQGSNESDFFLQPGANVISFLAADSTVTAAMRWRPQFNAVADLVP